MRPEENPPHFLKSFNACYFLRKIFDQNVSLWWEDLIFSSTVDNYQYPCIIFFLDAWDRVYLFWPYLILWFEALKKKKQNPLSNHKIWESKIPLPLKNSNNLLILNLGVGSGIIIVLEPAGHQATFKEDR